jgi:hypothetical protein
LIGGEATIRLSGHFDVGFSLPEVRWVGLQRVPACQKRLKEIVSRYILILSLTKEERTCVTKIKAPKGILSKAEHVVGTLSPAAGPVLVVSSTGHTVTVRAERVDAAGRLAEVLRSAGGAGAPSGAM